MTRVRRFTALSHGEKSRKTSGTRVSVHKKVRLCCSFCSLTSKNLAALWLEEKKISHLCHCQTRNSKGVFEKKKFPKGRGGLQKWNSKGMGVGQSILEFRCHPWYGTDVFWNCPMSENDR